MPCYSGTGGMGERHESTTFIMTLCGCCLHIVVTTVAEKRERRWCDSARVVQGDSSYYLRFLGHISGVVSKISCNCSFNSTPQPHSLP